MGFSFFSFSFIPYLLFALGLYLYLKGNTEQKKKVGKYILFTIIGIHILGAILLIVSFGMCLLNLN